MYDAAFAPITGNFADEALDHLGVGPGVRLIDVAAGTGAATLRAARRGASVLSTDFAPGMVDLVRERADEQGLGDRVETAVMDGQALDVDDGSFDASISMFGVIFFPDIDAGLRELARVVRPGGRGAVGAWLLDGYRLLDLVTAAVRRIVPDAPERGPVPWAELGRPDGMAAALTPRRLRRRGRPHASPGGCVSRTHPASSSTCSTGRRRRSPCARPFRPTSSRSRPARSPRSSPRSRSAKVGTASPRAPWSVSVGPPDQPGSSRKRSNQPRVLDHASAAASGSYDDRASQLKPWSASG